MSYSSRHPGNPTIKFASLNAAGGMDKGTAPVTTPSGKTPAPLPSPSTLIPPNSPFTVMMGNSDIMPSLGSAAAAVTASPAPIDESASSGNLLAPPSTNASNAADSRANTSSSGSSSMPGEVVMQNEAGQVASAAAQLAPPYQSNHQSESTSPTPPTPGPQAESSSPTPGAAEPASPKLSIDPNAGGLIVVSNRLPVTIKRDPKAEGGYTFTGSSGGLVSALGGCKKQMSFTWIGWPGLSVPTKEDERYIEKKLKEEYSCTPVWISDEIADRHYNGFSNSILWPLFHYHPGEMNFSEVNWLAYREANLMFAEKVRSVVKEGDMVWVQDYHLMLLPLMLRTLIEGSGMQGRTSQRELEHVRRGVDGTSRLAESEALAAPDDSPIAVARRRASKRTGTPSHAHEEPIEEAEDDAEDDNMTIRQNSSYWATGRGQGKGTSDGVSARGSVKIGFFLHTPFPSSEIYRILPVRREILLGILHSDLIGFHTYDYARHFLSSCTRILGLPTMPNGAEFEGRYVHVGAYPIGIEPSQFVEELRRDSVRERIKALERRFEGVKIIVGVDRLDYIKGVPQKLLGLETFLQEHPEWVGKVVLVQVAVPSRQDVEDYQNLRASVNETVGRINGHFGTVESMPIHFLHRSVPFDELCALYAVSDACLVTSTRDGMNLVSYEYIASQQDRKGVMILSEFAGAAQSLNGSLIVNPWDKFAVADAIHEALTMPIETRTTNFEKLSRYVNKHTSAWWGTSFVNDLGRIKVSKLRSDSPERGRRTSSISLMAI